MLEHASASTGESPQAIRSGAIASSAWRGCCAAAARTRLLTGGHPVLGRTARAWPISTRWLARDESFSDLATRARTASALRIPSPAGRHHVRLRADADGYAMTAPMQVVDVRSRPPASHSPNRRMAQGLAAARLAWHAQPGLRDTTSSLPSTPASSIVIDQRGPGHRSRSHTWRPGLPLACCHHHRERRRGLIQ
jgi:hypothetical protein